jgi:hypothetical protein
MAPACAPRPGHAHASKPADWRLASVARRTLKGAPPARPSRSAARWRTQTGVLMGAHRPMFEAVVKSRSLQTNRRAHATPTKVGRRLVCLSVGRSPPATKDGGRSVGRSNGRQTDGRTDGERQGRAQTSRERARDGRERHEEAETSLERQSRAEQSGGSIGRLEFRAALAARRVPLRRLQAERAGGTVKNREPNAKIEDLRLQQAAGHEPGRLS